MEKIQNKEAKKSYLMTLMMMQEVDNESTAEEEMFIYEVGVGIGLTNQDIKQVKEKPHEITYTLPKDQKERMGLFYHLMFLMKIDGEIHEKEIKLFREIASRLAINPLITQEFVQVAKDHIAKPIPKNMLLDILRKYMN